MRFVIDGGTFVLTSGERIRIAGTEAVAKPCRTPHIVGPAAEKGGADMDLDEYQRRQRQMDELLGIGRRGSTIDEALKLSRPLSEQLGLGRGSAIQQALEA